MNVFTKEELEIIQWEINTAVNNLSMALLSCDKHSALNEKLQSMIDSYCEHQLEPLTSFRDICVKCKKIF